MARDILGELKSRDGSYAPCWRPKDNETIVGPVVDFGVAQTAFGEVRVCTIEREDGGGRVGIFLSSEVLRREFERQKPKVGERIGVKFCGKHPKGYKMFVLIVDRSEEEPNFAPLGGERGDDCGPNDPFTDDGAEPFGTNPYPPNYQQATMNRPPARSNGRPLAVAPRGNR